MSGPDAIAARSSAFLAWLLQPASDSVQRLRQRAGGDEVGVIAADAQDVTRRPCALQQHVRGGCSGRRRRRVRGAQHRREQPLPHAAAEGARPQ
eukprot:CAMPEP_0180071838 /NCGR_PEP_ID=MMETSP0985-20121206/12373_1 /TAXON_ID=483367 /ORGANISM="non described non described, Strain CCMP 2436" /LENGTH=93 /DNA_ID=CAMNT_0022003123 /DNA_START=858 /DNA_END=1136 /DNA_ORIENTATION=+